ncbi:MAG: hypothetical protein HC819_21195 [Cyclobacteriaceae bacterium]|nr:hypothetical protein [Cyclobacteriaceae bacterium]
MKGIKTYNIVLGLLAVLLLAKPFETLAQQVNDAELKAISKYDGQQVKLRWAPDNYFAWRKLNQSGYVIERYTIKENGKLVSGIPVKEILGGGLIKPWPDEKWDQYPNNKFVALARETLKGQVTSSFGANANPGQIIDMANKEKNSFSFALYAADVEPLAAEALALSFTDTNIRPNAQYTYIIKPAVADSTYHIAQAILSVETDKPATLPAIENIKVINGDKVVQLAVYVAFLQDYYTAYKVEKKEALIHNYQELDRPMQVNLNPKGGVSDWMEVTDSLARNNVPVWYRIRGVDAFGDFGPYSEEIVVEGRELFEGFQSPTIDTLINQNNKSVLLRWSFVEYAKATTLEIWKATHIDGPYKIVQTMNTPKADGKFTDEFPSHSNYYKVAATDASDKRVQSYPRYIQFEDNTPPAMPQALSGDISTVGLVSLKWQMNAEQDLQGYRVFRANKADGEWMESTRDIVLASTYTDTISLETLTNDIHYKIQALDTRGNMSGFSKVLHLIKPDHIAPVPAQISNYTLLEDGQLMLDLQGSPSTDVERYYIVVVEASQTDTVQSWDAHTFPKQYKIANTPCATILASLTTMDRSKNTSATDQISFTFPCSAGTKAIEILKGAIAKEMEVWFWNGNQIRR